jgi:aspartate aminotransferase-like enzyme
MSSTQYALAEALAMVEEEGLEWSRHERNHKTLRA